MQCHWWGNRWSVATTMSNVCFRQQTESHEMTIVTSVHLFFLVGTDGKWPAPEPLSKLHNDKTVFSRHSASSRSVLRTDPCSAVDWTGKIPALPSSTTQTECTVRWSLQFIVRKGNEGGRKTQIEDRKHDKMDYHKMKTFKGNYLVIKIYNNLHLPVT